NDDALISLSGQNQHLQTPSRVGTASNDQTSINPSFSTVSVRVVIDNEEPLWASDVESGNAVDHFGRGH
ncbi:MAG: hypothetical protein ACKVHE_01910, partial [Planctomycetales bacterium]